jgi:hypothetical protein
VTDTVKTPVVASAAVAAPAPEPAAEPVEDEAAQQDTEVVRDAIRLLSWGREWHELPAAIARMAGRPKTAKIRRILKANREAIEQQAEGRAGTH